MSSAPVGRTRTNNDLESRFRDTGPPAADHGAEGPNAADAATPGRLGVLPRPPTEAKVLGALRQIPSKDLAQERQRFAEHRQRFRMQSRSLRQTQAQFDQLRQRWSALQATGTG